jgi:hypothetical protein
MMYLSLVFSPFFKKVSEISNSRRETQHKHRTLKTNTEHRMERELLSLLILLHDDAHSKLIGMVYLFVFPKFTKSAIDSSSTLVTCYVVGIRKVIC